MRGLRLFSGAARSQWLAASRLGMRPMSTMPHAPKPQVSSGGDGLPPPASDEPLGLKLPENVLRNLAAHGVRSLMPIQKATLATLREGVDVVARAKTGSGKTLAFLIPIMEQLAAAAGPSRSRAPVALIIEPTRELALQVARVIETFGMNVGVAVIYGGSSEGLQMRALREGAKIIVATPGRLCDFIRRRMVNLSELKQYVVDEADRLLDMGFEDELRQIGEALPKTRQTVMFSATLPDWTVKLAKSQLNPNMRVIDLVRDDATTVPVEVRHVACTIDPRRRHHALQRAIEEFGGGKTLVFASTKKEVDDIVRQLPDSAALHGGLTQKQRERVMHLFRKGGVDRLVATDVASRGLDIHDVRIVLQIRPKNSEKHPVCSEDYIHRAGRVGRAGQTGTSVFLYEAEEVSAVRMLERVTGAKFDRVNFDDGKGELDPIVEKPKRGLGESEERRKRWEMRWSDTPPQWNNEQKKPFEIRRGSPSSQGGRGAPRGRFKGGREGGDYGDGFSRRGNREERGGFEESKYRRRLD